MNDNDKPYTLILGDCLDKMKELPESSVDSIVTDPPYELGFMGKTWDSTGIAYSVPMWKEALRVLKPGGYILAFGGSRTYHRMTCAIEDAGFEIRDQIMWVYGSGFPKSLDVSKAIDKIGGSDFMDWFPEWLEEYRVKAGISRNQLAEHFRSRSGGKTGCIWNWEHGIRTPSAAQFNRLCELLHIPAEPLEVIERRVLAERRGVTKTFNVGAETVVGDRKPITAPATDAAKQWGGWGTALKPAHEPICVARKPLEGTVAQNVLKHGTGAINIDGCRVAVDPVADASQLRTMNRNQRTDDTAGQEWGMSKNGGDEPTVVRADGRWPANLIHDGSDEVVFQFPNSGNGNGKGAYSYAGREYDNKDTSMFNGDKPQAPSNFNDSGSASRFFYCAKTPKRERGEGNNHPTVKPLALMRYLCRLVTQKNGTILDPFTGSGSTGIAAIQEGFQFIGIEKDEAYLPIATKRISETERPRNPN